MNPLIIIPARGGSKGVPRKNLKCLGGRPLIEYTLNTARAIARDENICVSTDNDEIALTMESLGLKVPFMRPPSLAGDASGMDEVIHHALGYYISIGKKFDTFILLQPTSPFRKPLHVEGGLSRFEAGYDMVVSVKQTKANPYFVLFEESEEGVLKPSKSAGKFLRRQDTPDVYELNGSFYIVKVDAFERHRGLSSIKSVGKYVMSEYDSLDIDTELDWEIAEFLFERRR
ncbi:MAG: acylneuraminate cytidylyltransferase family protein [Cyclobacteriaceae bacterium]|nr:acylneuraminate cytidylyltransferase family protein [Cyclobacteriaceae bacterium HetDA_MAG_MS6]